MAEYTPVPLLMAAEQFAKLPGIGMKTAQRLAYHILTLPIDSAKEFAAGVLMARESVRFCVKCQNFTSSNLESDLETENLQNQVCLCVICQDEHNRNHKVICVVESPKDVSVFERTGGFNGVYHVLHGLLSPIDGTHPEDLRIRELMERLTENVDEIIMATNPTVEGEATATYIGRLVKTVGAGEIKVTRLAYGLPAGAALEFADDVTLTRALENRNEI
ncbi:MAG: recombination mediator RecR [Oscillospiraceae bacterium]|nr:recombination mediator RecR [Oscillospiraceae bacterium]